MVPIEYVWLSPQTPLLLLCLHVLCAGAVTVDALLKKGDVRAALGWIAMAWFSPLLGALLYYLFGINRVIRRASKLDRLDSPRKGGQSVSVPAGADNIAAMAAVSERVTGSPLTAGNQVTVLENGDAAYPAMLAAIGDARHCVALESYIFRDDAVGRRFVEALIAAHRRGVQVRVLIDSVGGGYIRCPALEHLRAAGVPAALFLHTWIPWRMPFLNMRNHRKLLIADGRTGFMGGMNIGAEYSHSTAKVPVEDIHFRVEGPAVRQMMDAFARDWTFTTGEALDDAAWWPELQPMGQLFARGVRSGPDADIYKIETMLGAALTQAKKRIRIVTPYFLPDQRLQFAIAQAVLRGVTVEILLPRQCNYFFMDWALRAHLRFFRHAPADFYFTPLPFDHTKLVTMDGTWSLIGSSNWDTRSLRLNFEFDLECYDAGLTAALDRVIDAKRARATRVGPADLDRPVPIRLRDAATRLLLPYL